MFHREDPGGWFKSLSTSQHPAVLSLILEYPGYPHGLFWREFLTFAEAGHG